MIELMFHGKLPDKLPDNSKWHCIPDLLGDQCGVISLREKEKSRLAKVRHTAKKSARGG